MLESRTEVVGVSLEDGWGWSLAAEIDKTVVRLATGLSGVSVNVTPLQSQFAASVGVTTQSSMTSVLVTVSGTTG